MRPDGSSFLSREELLGGLSAKRANTLLYVIENRTAQLVARSRSALAAYQSERSTEERERAFLDAMSAGREPSAPVRVTDLERYAPDWARLVPADPSLRAALGRLLGAKYRFTRRLTPRLSAAIGIDDPAVRQAFARVQGAEPGSIFATSLSPRERLRWGRARFAERLETLPPFWTAFALTLTETVGAGLLALPIALASLGALGAVVLVIVLGAINLVTIAALMEAIVRSGRMRYGTAFLGRLVGDYLGRPGKFAMRGSLFAYSALVVVILFLGFGSAVGAATGLPIGLWVGGLLIVVLAVVARGSIDATIASALVIGGVNIAIIAAISLVSLTRLDGARLSPPSDAGGSGVSVLGVAAAVVLASYFGHTAAANAAKSILRRDPSGSALMRGSLAAMAVTIALYAVTVVAIIGLVGTETLLGHPGTFLELVADRFGPVFGLLGVLYASLAMGLGAVHGSLGLANQLADELSSGFGDRVARLTRSQIGGTAIRVVPVALIVIALEWMLLVGAESFTGLLNLGGALGVPLLGGVFPMLLVMVGRRRGEHVPGWVVRFVGHPAVVTVIAAFYLGIVIFHGVVIFESPLERALAFSVAIGMIVVTAMALRGQALRPRAVIELNVDEAGMGRARFAVSAHGQPVPVPVSVDHAGTVRTLIAADGEAGRIDQLRSLVFDLPAALAPELTVWLHRVTSDNESVGLPMRVDLAGGEPLVLDHEGQAVVLLPASETRLTIRT